jgi:hypothetical protein
MEMNELANIAARRFVRSRGLQSKTGQHVFVLVAASLNLGCSLAKVLLVGSVVPKHIAEEVGGLHVKSLLMNKMGAAPRAGRWSDNPSRSTTSVRFVSSPLRMTPT